MLDRLSKLVPISLRARLYDEVAQRIRIGDLRQHEATEAALPHVDLRAEHLAHLRVVPNRAAMLACLPKAGVVAELGVAAGDFSSDILTVAQPARLHLIDAWVAEDPRYRHQRTNVERRFANEINAGRVAIHTGQSIAELAKFAEAYFDWIYIDTSHDYATTARELALGRSKVKPGGIIAGHDYVVGNWRNRVRYGVIEAVHEYCVEYNWELIFLTHEVHRHLSFAIRAIEASPRLPPDPK